MKVRIEHASNPLNYGTNMMVTNFIYYLNKKNKNIEFFIDVNNNEDLNRYILGIGLNKIYKETIDYNLCISNSNFDRVINKLKRDFFYNYFYEKEFNKLKSNTENLVILGGDDISEYYGIEGLEKELNRLKNIKNDMKVLLVGQTMGPFSSENRKKLVKESLDKISIYSRDEVTKKYMENEIGIKNIKKSSDLAFLNLPNQNNKTEEITVLEKYKLKNDYITIVPSGLSNCYCEDQEIYIKRWISIINDIRKNYKEKKIVLLAHVLVNSNDDRKIIEKIYDGLDDKKKIIKINDELLPLHARFILGNGDLTITGRMHAAISTFQMKKPAISLSYSIKYEGVIGKGLGLSELIIDAMGEELWSGNYLNNSIINKIGWIYENYETICNKINISVEKCKEEALNMINEINNELNYKITMEI